MLDDAEQYLAEMEECVKWYEERVVVAKQRVEHLRSLMQYQPTEPPTE